MCGIKRGSIAPLYFNTTYEVYCNQRFEEFGVSMSEKNWYLLRNKVFERKYSEASILLKEESELVDVRNGIGETVLHFLAVENDIEGVAWLKSRGFDLDCKNEFGVPVVFEVAQLGYRELLEWFQKHGANLFAKDNENQSIIEYLKEYDEIEMICFAESILNKINKD